MPAESYSLVVAAQFVQATRDSGYKTLGSALAELVDNAFEARATRVEIRLDRVAEAASADVVVIVSDNGRGMDASSLRHSLQFGWSSRFNKRDGQGRYGMGLPNASLSHARRVEVYSCRKGESVHASYLDVDEIVVGKGTGIGPVRSVSRADFERLSPHRQEPHAEMWLPG